MSSVCHFAVGGRRSADFAAIGFRHLSKACEHRCTQYIQSPSGSFGQCEWARFLADRKMDQRCQKT